MEPNDFLAIGPNGDIRNRVVLDYEDVTISSNSYEIEILVRKKLTQSLLNCQICFRLFQFAEELTIRRETENSNCYILIVWDFYGSIN